MYKELKLLSGQTQIPVVVVEIAGGNVIKISANKNFNCFIIDRDIENIGEDPLSEINVQLIDPVQLKEDIDNIEHKLNNITTD
jgi:hypothetical protein